MPDLRSLFEFSSIAVIGASESSGHGSGPWEALREVGFEGRYFPINPRREQVHGFKAYPAVTDVPEEVQAAVIAVPRDAVLPALQGCADKGVRAVTIVSSGFAEADDTGRALQAQISKLARERNIIVVGPNCF
ncbi:MAG TPA: CoA-binding protein, partial [Chloroflexota bacterium]|nr:CoA-binding protein [Chloroflexota bacterium]